MMNVHEPPKEATVVGNPLAQGFRLLDHVVGVARGAQAN